MVILHPPPPPQPKYRPGFTPGKPMTFLGGMGVDALSDIAMSAAIILGSPGPWIISVMVVALPRSCQLFGFGVLPCRFPRPAQERCLVGDPESRP